MERAPLVLLILALSAGCAGPPTVVTQLKTLACPESLPPIDCAQCKGADSIASVPELQREYLRCQVRVECRDRWHKQVATIHQACTEEDSP